MFYDFKNSFNGDIQIITPDNHFFALGNNIEQSIDSRIIGSIPYNNIYSLVIK